MHELIPTPAGELVFHNGGLHAGSAGRRYGELRLGDLAERLPTPVPAGGGRGAACPLAPGPAYVARVASIPNEMHYKRPQDVPSGSNRGTSYMHYGDPGAGRAFHSRTHYSYLLWSFVNVRGGGMVRTLLAPGQVVRPCDVQPLTRAAWDRSGRVNGSVTARYVRALVGTCPIYGWMVWSHTYYAGSTTGPVAHALPLRTNPPPEPQADPGCPP
jgi:hypothetical protein